jgi:hypothetical protein
LFPLGESRRAVPSRGNHVHSCLFRNLPTCLRPPRYPGTPHHVEASPSVIRTRGYSGWQHEGDFAGTLPDGARSSLTALTVSSWYVRGRLYSFIGLHNTAQRTVLATILVHRLYVLGCHPGLLSNACRHPTNPFLGRFLGQFLEFHRTTSAVITLFISIPGDIY